MKNLTKIGLAIVLVLGFTSTLSAGNVKVKKSFLDIIDNAYVNNSLK